MHETLRRRIMRSLETLPEAKLYQVVDYIEFLESHYGEGTVPEATGLQKLAERLEDGLRKRTLNPSNLREAFQLIAAADRVLGSVTEAGREILGDLSISSGETGDRQPGSVLPRARPEGADPSGSRAPGPRDSGT